MPVTGHNHINITVTERSACINIIAISHRLTAVSAVSFPPVNGSVLCSAENDDIPKVILFQIGKYFMKWKLISSHHPFNFWICIISDILIEFIIQYNLAKYSFVWEAGEGKQTADDISNTSRTKIIFYEIVFKVKYFRNVHFRLH